MRKRALSTIRVTILSAVVTLGLPSARAMAADGWGASWSFGPVHPTTTNHIIYTKTTLVPGRLPTLTGVGPLFLWPGISNPTSDLIQTTMDDMTSGGNGSYCGGNGSQWCVEASVFGSFGQRNGPTVPIDPDDHVTIEYTLGSDNNTWTQTVTSQKLGKVVSTLTSTSGLMVGGGFGFATEAQGDSFTIDTQYYLCSEAKLAVADPAFGATGVGANGAQHGATGTGSGPGTAKNIHTPDNGLTWLVDLITLPAMMPQGTQTPPPTVDCSTDGGAGSSSSSSGSSSGSGSGSSSSSSGGKGSDAGSSGGGSSSGSSSSGGKGSSSSSGGSSSGASSGSSGSNSGSGGNSSGSGSSNGASSSGTSNGGTGTSNGGGASSSGASSGSGITGSSGGSGGSGSSAGSATSASSGGAGSGDTGFGNSSGASGCGCSLVGANVGARAGLAALALGLAATFVRRRRKASK